MSDRTDDRQSTSAAAIRFTHVGVRYPGGRGGAAPIEALRDVSFAVSRGQFVAIVGPSGCGKSTLLRLLAGLRAPDSGRVLADGTDVSAPRDDVAMVFQRPTLLPWRTVRGNIVLPDDVRPGQRAAHDRADALLRLVGLDAFADRYPAELSGGMQQRVALARALAVAPSLLLMDEPFAALDALLREELATELERIWTEPVASRDRPTVLFVTHSIAEAVQLADRVLVMSPRPGTIVADIPVDLARPRQPDPDDPGAGAVSRRIRQALRAGAETSH